MSALMICRTCVDYADEGAILRSIGERWCHIDSDLEKCPGQESDDTEDYSDPITPREYAESADADHAVKVLLAVIDY